MPQGGLETCQGQRCSLAGRPTQLSVAQVVVLFGRIQVFEYAVIFDEAFQDRVTTHKGVDSLILIQLEDLLGQDPWKDNRVPASTLAHGNHNAERIGPSEPRRELGQ